MVINHERLLDDSLDGSQTISNSGQKTLRPQPSRRLSRRYRSSVFTGRTLKKVCSTQVARSTPSRVVEEFLRYLCTTTHLPACSRNLGRPENWSARGVEQQRRAPRAGGGGGAAPSQRAKYPHFCLPPRAPQGEGRKHGCTV
jgi:hypothetical protein